MSLTCNILQKGKSYTLKRLLLAVYGKVLLLLEINYAKGVSILATPKSSSHDVFKVSTL